MPLFETETESELRGLVQTLRATGPQAMSLEQKLELLTAMRASHPDHGAVLDESLLSELARLRAGLERAHRDQQELRKVFDKLSAPPWHVGIFLGGGTAGTRESAAIVASGANRSVVNFAEGVDPSTFAVGDEVLLGPEHNLVVARSPFGNFAAGETAVFDRMAADGRLVVRVRDEEFVLTASERLTREVLHSGDIVRWDRGLWMAFERLERSKGQHLFLDNTPTETFAAIGGLDQQVQELQRLVQLHYERRDLVEKYSLQRRTAVLLAGPPGTGKTLIARALANWLAQLSPSGASKFMNIKPNALHSMWFSQSEQNYRDAFRIAREASERDPGTPVVMFFDEIDSIGGARGNSGSGIEDRVMTAFLAELNGLESRGNVLVVCATNRRDALDPALLRSGGRLGDIVLEIPRPNRRAAREIFNRHLPQGIPYHTDVVVSAAFPAREAMIDAAVARIFGPNGLGELATLVFRDGKRRAVVSADLVSGAAIANIARRATERACQREVEQGAEGLRLDDVLTAVDMEFETAARTLTPANARRFLESLPQDTDVVRVERSATPMCKSYRYLSVA